MGLLISFIHVLSVVLTICIFADILVSYFLSPYHPVRSFLDKIVQPMLNPIRRVIPMIGMFDLSPLVLLILIRLLESLLTGILASL